MNNGRVYARQSATYNKAIDLSTAILPTLYFEETYALNSAGTMYIEISLDGLNWTGLFQQGRSNDYVWKRKAIDLSLYAGEPEVHVRFRTYPLSTSEYWQIPEIEVKEKEPVNFISYPAFFSFEETEWTLEGKEEFYENTDQWELIGGWNLPSPLGILSMNNGRVHARQSATYNKAIDLSTAILPTLYFAETYALNSAGPMYIEISLDGLNWTGLFQQGRSNDYVWKRKTIDLSPYAGEPDVHVRFRTYPLSTSEYWQIREIEVKEKEL